MYKALSIAGSDSCGGAGIQADIKTMTALGVYGMTAITALTAQNTTGVKQVEEVTKEFLEAQLDCIFEDIRPDAVKTGMIPNAELMEAVAQRLSYYEVHNLVIDPVMVATSGSSLMANEAVDTLKNKLLPLKGLITPNIPETQVLVGQELHTEEDMEAAAKLLYDVYGCSVLVKGGHGIKDANDYLYHAGKGQWLRGERIDNPNTHGTGCTLSSAIASFLAMGEPLEDAVAHGKDYLTGAIRAGLDLGKGSGPLNHMYRM